MDSTDDDHSNGRLGLRTAARLQAKVRERGLAWGLSCTPALSVTNSAAEAAYVAIVALHKWTLPLPFTYEART